MTTAAEEFDKVSKALTSAFANSIARRARMQAFAPQTAKAGVIPVETDVDIPLTVGVAEEQPVIGTTRPQDLTEPPVIPVRVIHNTVDAPSQPAEVYKSCGGCGRMCKSQSCFSCDIASNNEAMPFWNR